MTDSIRITAAQIERIRALDRTIAQANEEFRMACIPVMPETVNLQSCFTRARNVIRRMVYLYEESCRREQVACGSRGPCLDRGTMHSRG